MLALPLLLLVTVVSSVAQLSDSCEFLSQDDEARRTLDDFLGDASVKLVEYDVQVDGYSHQFWRGVGGNYWFQPWRWYRSKGSNSERLLLLYHYYFGLLKPYLGMGSRDVNLRLTVNGTGCLDGLTANELESKLRRFLYYDLKNATERQSIEFTDNIRVCTMHVDDYGGWGRLVYRCCSRDQAGVESCSNVSDDEWVWVLRAFIICLSILMFLYFPKFIPKGYYVYSFQYYPPDGQTFNLLRTANPAKYKDAKDSIVLPAARWRKLRKLAAEADKLQPEVVHQVKIKRVTFECNMDRLLSETASPVSVFRSLFDTFIRCKVRHADSLEDCCNAPVCGQLCCPRCPPWHAWMRALRTIVLMLVLAVPALPRLYIMAANDLDYQEVADMIEERDLRQSYNIYSGNILSKVAVGVMSALYVLHMVLVLVDGCHDQNLAKTYTELLQVTRHNARLRDRLRNSRSIIRMVVWPVKRFGVVAVPVGLVLLLLLPVLLLLYLLLTSPVPKLLLHALRLLRGKTTGRRKKTKAEMSTWDLIENVLFVITLIDVFVVLTLALNFLVHVLIVAIVQLITNIDFILKFFTILVLLIVYIRDAFRQVNNTYASHHTTVLGYVRAVEEEDLTREADKDWRDQENKIFKVVPSSAADAKGRTGKDEEAYKKKKLFLIKNDALRMRTRSLVLFLDKDDIPYIPKKFLEHTTTISCPGSPGKLEEAYLRALGRFARTAFFLALIVLPLLAYAGTYEVSSNLQVFAVLFTGTIPLIMRYFCMSPGAMMKVDTSTLRFRTQMDDKVESFMQSWVVEDVVVDHFRLPTEENDDPHAHEAEDEPGANAQAAAEDTEDTPPQPLPSKQPPATPARQSKRPYGGGGGQGAGNGAAVGHLNYMPALMDVENSEDWIGFQTATNHHTAMQPDDGYNGNNGMEQPLQGHKHHHKKEKKKRKNKQSPLPLVDDLQAKGEGGEGGGALAIGSGDHATLNNNETTTTTRTEQPVNADGDKEPKKKKKKKPKKEKLKIHLVLDISDDKAAAVSGRFGRLDEEKGDRAGIPAGPPYFHWNRRSRLVDENKGRAEYDV